MISDDDRRSRRRRCPRLEALRAELADAEEEVHRPAPPAPGEPGPGPDARGEAARDQGPAGPGRLPEREADLHPPAAKEHWPTSATRSRSSPSRPSAYGTFLGANDDGTVDVFSGGRKMRVLAAPRHRPGPTPQRGDEVVLNESLNVVLAREGERLRRGGHAEGAARGRPPGHRLRPGRRGAGGRARPRRCIGRQAAGRRHRC